MIGVGIEGSYSTHGLGFGVKDSGSRVTGSEVTCKRFGLGFRGKDVRVYLATAASVTLLLRKIAASTVPCS